jgi:hypothetical protein
VRDTKLDSATAAIVALSAFAVYLATLAPGLIAIEDTPKFQFIGRILGTAHNPGYPLYVLVSYFFGYLPVGTLAYRINLMSAVFGAASCGLLFLSARRLGAGRWAAACAALGFGLGATVWYSSTIAEVYTFNGFLVAAIVASLLAWSKTALAAWFYTAIAVFALALGLHTTVLFLVPTVGLFACLVAPRFVLRPRTIGAAAAIVAAGLTQYLFIIVRTRQGAWGESRATTLTELARVITGSEYTGAILAEGMRDSLTVRVPLVARGFAAELTVAGVGLAIAGAIALWRRSKPAFALTTAGIAPFAVFAVVYYVPLFHVFLVPAFVMSWLLVAVGAEDLGAFLRARAGRWAAAPAAALLAVIPVWQIARNLEARDLSHSFGDMRFFDALVEGLPDGSALLHEDFLVDRMVYYKKLGEEAWRGRRVEVPVPGELERITRLHREGYGIFAFPQTARLMRLLDGAEFSYAPLELRSGTIDRYLAELPRGSIVAIAVPAVHLRAFLRDGRLPFDAIGYAAPLGGLDVVGVAVAGVAGAGVAESAVHQIAARIRLDAGSGAVRSPLPIAVEAGQEVASIQVAGREILRTSAGMAAAVWRRDGGQAAAFVVPAAAPRAPTPPTPLAVYRMRALREWQTVGAAPQDVTAALASGTLVVRTEPGRSRVLMYAGRRRPLAPVLLDCSARSWPSFDVRAFDGTRAELSRALDADAMSGAAGSLLALPYVYRIALASDFSSPVGVLFGLGAGPDAAYGRVTSGPAVRVYGPDLASHLARVDDRTVSLHMARDHHSHLIGAGWSDVQADAVGPFREARGDAELLLPLSKPAALGIGIQLALPPGEGSTPVSVQLRFNGSPLPSVAASPGWQRYWWDVPAALGREGVNSAVISVSPPGSRLVVSDLLIENR